MTDERLELALRDVGADHTPDPNWQERVLAAVAEPESAWHLYRLALWIGLAIAAAVVGLAWIA